MKQPELRRQMIGILEAIRLVCFALRRVARQQPPNVDRLLELLRLLLGEIDDSLTLCSVDATCND